MEVDESGDNSKPKPFQNLEASADEQYVLIKGFHHIECLKTFLNSKDKELTR